MINKIIIKCVVKFKKKKVSKKIDFNEVDEIG